jgi:sugar phosphate permease
VSIFFGLPFEFIKYVWLLNGASQSVLWTSLLMTTAKNLDEKHVRTSILALGTTVSIGTFLSYGLSALLALFGGWKFSFLISAIAMVTVGVVWFLIYGKITLKSENTVENNKDKQVKDIKPKQKNQLSTTIIYTFLLFGFLAIITNLVKDGLASWVPKILKDNYKLADSLSIILTLILPVLAIFGNFLAVTLVKKLKDHTYSGAVIFILVTAFTLAVTLFLKTPYWWAVLLAFGFLSLFSSSSNSLITSVIPMQLRDKANSGFIGGILNGCCYLGSTISSVGLGAIADAYGNWSPVFVLLLILGGSAAVVSTVCAIVIKIRNKKRLNKSV